MVVRLHLERDGDAVPEVDHAGVLSGALEHPLAARRQPLQEARRMLVAAMLRPEEREDGELEVVGGPPEKLADVVELTIREAETAVKRGRDRAQGTTLPAL
jgi:hypothetical protein